LIESGDGFIEAREHVRAVQGNFGVLGASGFGDAAG